LICAFYKKKLNAAYILPSFEQARRNEVMEIRNILNDSRSFPWTINAFSVQCKSNYGKFPASWWEITRLLLVKVKVDALPMQSCYGRENK